VVLVCASRLYQNCVKNLFCWEHYKQWARWYEFLSAANEARFTIVEEFIQVALTSENRPVKGIFG